MCCSAPPNGSRRLYTGVFHARNRFFSAYHNRMCLQALPWLPPTAAGCLHLHRWLTCHCLLRFIAIAAILQGQEVPQVSLSCFGVCASPGPASWVGGSACLRRTPVLAWRTAEQLEMPVAQRCVKPRCSAWKPRSTVSRVMCVCGAATLKVDELTDTDPH